MNVSKRYRRYAYRNLSLKGQVMDRLHGRNAQFVEFDALRDVTFQVPTSQTLAIVGANGAGKSTLLRVLAGILEPDAGCVQVRGRVTPLLELGAGFAPELSGRRNIYLYGALLGLSRAEITERLPAIVEFSGVGDFIETPVKHYSSGMYVRLAFSIAVHVDPDVLLLDEILAVGDASFKAKCLTRMNQFRTGGKTIAIVTHELRAIADMCDRAILLHRGHMVEDGPPAQVLDVYERITAA